MNHTELCHAIIKQYSRGSIRLWLNSVAFAYTKDGRPIGRIGKKGQADCSGILNFKGLGIRLEVEAKVGRDKQRDEQKKYEGLITTFGGVYILARELKDVEEGIQQFVGKFGGFYDASSGRVSTSSTT